MDDMTHYFSVGKGSPLVAEVEKLKALMTEQHKARKVLLKELCLPRTDGLEEVLMVSGGGYVIGLKIQAVPRKKNEPYRQVDWEERRLKRVGWRWDRKDGFNKPDLRTPEGKAIKARMKTAPGNLDWMNISSRLFKDSVVFGGMACYYVVMWWNKDTIIVKMASCVLKKIDKALLKQYKMKEITASAANKLMGSKDDGDEEAA